MLSDLPKQFHVQVTNFGNKERSCQIEFSVDGQAIDSQTIKLRAGESRETIFGCRFSEQGWYTLSAKITRGADAVLTEDNSAQFVTQVVAPQRVLLISEMGRQRNNEEFDPESDFLKLALAPFEQKSTAAGRIGRQERSPNRFDIRHISSNRVRGSDFEAGYQAVILSGVSKLDSSNTNALTKYVEQGGGLIVFPGDKLNQDWYDNLVEQRNLLAFAFGPKQDSKIKLLRETIQFPQLQVFNSSAAGDLSEIEINTWHKLENVKNEFSPNKNSTNKVERTFDVALRLQNGLPFLCTNRVGKGLVVQSAISCSDKWSNLPLRSAFVPLMQQVTFAATKSEVSPNIQSGETILLSLPETISTPQSTNLQLQYVNSLEGSTTFEGPNVKQLPWPSSTSFSFRETQHPGLTLVRLAPNSSSLSSDTASKLATENRSTSKGDPEITPPLIAIAPGPRESDLLELGTGQLANVAEQLNAQLLTSASEFKAQSSLLENGREIWRWFLIALLALLFGEILLGKAITKGSVG